MKTTLYRELRREDPGYPARLGHSLGETAPARLQIYGDLRIADIPLLAVFASIRTPPGLMLRGLDATRIIRAARVAVIGGFQSPLEREALRLLLRGEQPLVVCSARRVERMRLPRAWRRPLQEERLLIVGSGDNRWRRATVRSATHRNRLVTALADAIFVVHAHAGSRTYRTIAEALKWERRVYCIDHPANRDLVLLGAEPVKDLKAFPPLLASDRQGRE